VTWPRGPGFPSPTKRKRPEVADILRRHIGGYQKQYPLWSELRKIVYDLLNCRTAYLGGHIERWSHCGAMLCTYHSYRNRHCPTCQHMLRERWLQKRRNEILPVKYFHVVFTLPHELNPYRGSVLDAYLHFLLFVL